MQARSCSEVPNRRGKAILHGTCAVNGPIEARISAARGALRGLDWHTVGEADGRKFEATLERIPSGGPYTVELRADTGKAQESVTVEDVYVGDVWFLAGQSNMQGVGNTQDAPRSHPLVRAFYMRDEWGLADEPLHWLSEAVDFVHNSGVRQTKAQAERERKAALKGVGPGVYFGREMVKRNRVPQGLVLCAHGGTSMAQWSPDLKGEGGRSLYGAMLRRYQLLGQPIRGLLWYQGESDANPEAAAIYTQRMQELVAATREDFGQPDLPWVVVQIGRVLSPYWAPDSWNSIQEQQRRLPEVIQKLDVVPTIDLELDDTIHISGRAYATLGHRLARAADRLALGNRREKGALELDSIKAYPRKDDKDPIQNGIQVTFRNVVGKLESAGRPVGFSAIDPAGQPVPVAYKTRLDGNAVILETLVEASAMEAYRLSYGYGLDPVCNIVDSRGMAVPVFGPLPMNGKGGTSFITTWRVSRPQRVRGGVRRAAWPASGLPRNAWTEPHNNQGYLVMPQDVTSAQPGIFYMRSTISASESINTILAVGADGPFRVWLNGQPLAVEADATNPCTADQYQYPVSLKKGDNEVVIAFDGREGRGWGIAARFLPSGEDKAIPEGVIQV